MNFNDLVKNNEAIKNITDGAMLEKLYNEGKAEYKSVEDTFHAILCRKSELREEAYRKNRGIKKRPILNTLLDQLGEKYKEAIIDLDEYFGCMSYNEYFRTGKLYNILCEHGLIKDDNGKAYEIIMKFLQDNNLIMPKYDYKCSRCNDTLFTLDKMPTTQQELEELLEEECCECDTCCEEVTAKLENIEKSDFYKVVREDKK